MIRQLRKRHQLIWIPVVIIAVIILVLSPSELVYKLNASLPGISKNFETLSLIEEATISWNDLDADGKVFRSENDELVFEMESREYISQPDILLYLNRIGGSKLTNDSILLGTYQQNDTQQWILPDSSFTDGSILILYSLPKKKVVASAEVTLMGGGS